MSQPKTGLWRVEASLLSLPQCKQDGAWRILPAKKAFWPLQRSRSTANTGSLVASGPAAHSEVATLGAWSGSKGGHRRQLPPRNQPMQPEKALVLQHRGRNPACSSAKILRKIRHTTPKAGELEHLFSAICFLIHSASRRWGNTIAKFNAQTRGT